MARVLELGLALLLPQFLQFFVVLEPQHLEVVPGVGGHGCRDGLAATSPTGSASSSLEASSSSPSSSSSSTSGPPRSSYRNRRVAVASVAFRGHQRPRQLNSSTVRLAYSLR